MTLLIDGTGTQILDWLKAIVTGPPAPLRVYG